MVAAQAALLDVERLAQHRLGGDVVVHAAQEHRQQREPRERGADDVARAVVWALGQPPHVDVNEILVRPTSQPQ